MTKSYLIKHIRSLLSEFTIEELQCFAYDETDFRAVYDHLTQPGKNQIIKQLIEHAAKTAQVETLLSWAKKQKPAGYKKYQPYYDEPANGGNKKPGRVRNPFHYGGPVPPESFIGHQKAVDFCRIQLADRRPTNIAINGERRIGKTSLLHYLKSFGPQETWGQYRCLFLDLGIFGSGFTATIFWQEVLALLRATLEGDSLLADPIAHLQNQAALTHTDFRRLLQHYQRLYPERLIILLLDEFEFIHEADAPADILITLRSLTQSPTRQFTLVTATREPLSQVCQALAQAKSFEFHSSFVPCPLEPFDQLETYYVVQTLLNRTGVEFTPEELDYIWQISQGSPPGAHPILVQVAASLIFEHKQKNNGPINYFDLTRQFEQQTRLYRSRSPSLA